MDLQDIWNTVFSFQDYAEILPLVTNSLIAGALLGLVGGMIGIFVMLRDMAFAVHGIAELSFAGAAFALLIGANVVFGSLIGSVVAALVLGMMGAAAKDRNSIIGVLMPFGLGLGILFLALYEGRSANKFGLLTGQIVAVDQVQLGLLAVCSVVVLIALVAMWRPLTFISVDPAVATARGIPAAKLSVAFMLVLGLAVALSIQVVGSLLVLSLLITPAAAAMRVTRKPGAHREPFGVLRGDVRGGRHPAGAGRQPADQPVRDDDFVPHLRRLPADRLAPRQGAAHQDGGAGGLVRSCGPRKAVNDLGRNPIHMDGVPPEAFKGCGGSGYRPVLLFACIAVAGLRAGGAQPVDLHGVGGIGEAVLGGNAGRPLLDGGRLDLDGLAAGAAHQVVVVVLGLALAVHGLALGAAQHVHQAVLGHGQQQAVDGRQRDLVALVDEPAVELLGRHEVIDLAQGRDNRQPLLGDALLGTAPLGRGIGHGWKHSYRSAQHRRWASWAPETARQQNTDDSPSLPVGALFRRGDRVWRERGPRN